MSKDKYPCIFLKPNEGYCVYYPSNIFTQGRILASLLRSRLWAREAFLRQYKERNSCPRLQSCYIGSSRVGVSQSLFFSRSMTSLAVLFVIYYFYADQIPCWILR